MGKNLIPVVANELSIEVGEVFRIEGDVGDYRFTEKGLEWRDDDKLAKWEIADAADSIVWDLIRGFSKVIKIPFEPRCKDKYWTYFYCNFMVGEEVWSNTASDYARQIVGIVFRTEQEAVKARPEIYKRLTGKEWGK